MTNRKNIWIKKAKQKQIIEFGGMCQVLGCDKKDNLEFAHKKGYTENNGRGRGRKERYYAVKRNPEQYLLLCKEHHHQYDEYEITLKTGEIV